MGVGKRERRKNEKYGKKWEEKREAGRKKKTGK